MLEQLLVYEREAFLWLNGSHTPYWDQVMWLYSGKAVWLPLALFILFVLSYRKNWREVLLLFLAIALTITLCDQFASHLCKPLFTRFRPTHHPDFQAVVQTVMGYRGGLYGFISSHAANAFGFAMFMTLLFRNRLFGCTVFLWATINAYSRIYLGVHFLTDIIPGALSGLFFGWIVYRFYGWLRNHFLSTRIHSFIQHSSALYSARQINLITAAIWLAFLLLLLYAAIQVNFSNHS